MSHIVIDARIINSTTGRYIQQLLNNLEVIDQDNRYTVVVPTKDKTYWQPTNPNFSVRTIDIASFSLAEQFPFKTFLQSLQPDLVHFCLPQQPMFYRGRKVTTFHDLSLLKTYNSDKNWLVYHFKQFIGRFVLRSIAANATELIAVSRYTEHDMVKYLDAPTDKINVIYEAADIGDIEPVAYAVPYKHYLLYVGKQSDYENIKRLAAAHQELLKTYPELGLVLVGKQDKASRANEAYFTTNGYRNIVYTGYVDDAELVWLFQNAAAYAFPSLLEGFGLPGLEAMAYGTPVVSSNATCLPEVLGAAAHYFDPTDTADMVRALDEVLKSPELQAELRVTGYEQVKKYSWRKTAEETLAVYQKALQR